MRDYSKKDNVKSNNTKAGRNLTRTHDLSWSTLIPKSQRKRKEEPSDLRPACYLINRSNIFLERRNYPEKSTAKETPRQEGLSDVKRRLLEGPGSFSAEVNAESSKKRGRTRMIDGHAG